MPLQPTPNCLPGSALSSEPRAACTRLAELLQARQEQSVLGLCPRHACRTTSKARHSRERRAGSGRMGGRTLLALNRRVMRPRLDPLYVQLLGKCLVVIVTVQRQCNGCQRVQRAIRPTRAAQHWSGDRAAHSSERRAAACSPRRGSARRTARVQCAACIGCRTLPNTRNRQAL